MHPLLQEKIYRKKERGSLLIALVEKYIVNAHVDSGMNYPN